MSDCGVATGAGSAGSENEAVALTTWLRMLGWQVQLEMDGQLFVGVARQITADGSRLAVSSCGTTKVDAVWRLFEPVTGKLSGDDASEKTLRRRIEPGTRRTSWRAAASGCVRCLAARRDWRRLSFAIARAEPAGRQRARLSKESGPPVSSSK